MSLRICLKLYKKTDSIRFSKQSLVGLSFYSSSYENIYIYYGVIIFSYVMLTRRKFPLLLTQETWCYRYSGRGVTLNKLRYPLLNSNIELHSRTKKNKSTAFNEFIMELLKPSNGCAPHTCTSEITEVTDKEVYFPGQTS